MNIEEKILTRLEELEKIGLNILHTSTTETGYIVRSRHTYTKIDVSIAVQWRISCLQILSKVFGGQSHYYIEFKKNSDALSSLAGHGQMVTSLGILKAAKDDYENGYLFDTRTLIEAEVFDDFLEQAEELLKKGFFLPSAVIAGCVLEDGLRKLCNRNNITFPKKPTIEPMNVELAKIGIYNQSKKDKISSIGKLRNYAAHGEWTEFTEKDVEEMIRDVRRFMEDYFS